MEVIVSVIVPVFNVEGTLERCIDSILNQTYRDYEIILVDDGSTDNSGILCDKYASDYNNISVIHKKNEGLGPTRNIGVMASKGKFILHCDSDDWIKPDLLAKAVNEINKSEAEIVLFGYDMFVCGKEQRLSPYRSVNVSAGHYLGHNQVISFFQKEYLNDFITMSACNKLYRKDFLLKNKLVFPDLRRCQDMAYSLMLFDACEKLTTMDQAFYCYVTEPGVYKGRDYREKVGNYLDVYELTKKYYSKWGIFELQKNTVINRISEQIANYSAYALSHSFANQKAECVSWLVNDKRIRELFNEYTNTKKSRFMMMFCFAIKIKSKHLILFLSAEWNKKVHPQEV